MDPKISVIIPVYNVLPYLREALDSAVGQTYRTLEILIVDDGSTDGSEAVCDEYLADPRVRVIHQSNKGLSGARNAGLDRMTGEYVAFLDPDDAYRPEMLGRMLRAAQRDDADMVICSFDKVKTVGRLEDTPPCSSCRYNDALLTARGVLNLRASLQASSAVWHRLYKRSLWDGLRFTEGRVYEDVLICCALFERCRRVRTMAERLYLYRKRPDSISGSLSLSNFRDRLFALETLEEYVRAHTPEYFEEGALRALRERDLVILEIKCAKSMARMTPEQRPLWKEARRDLLSKSAALGRFGGARNRAVVRLFRISPRLLRAAIRIYAFFTRRGKT